MLKLGFAVGAKIGVGLLLLALVVLFGCERFAPAQGNPELQLLQTVRLGDLLPLKHGQHAIFFDSESNAFYLVTTFMHEDPTKPCPVFPPGPEANPGIALHEYDAGWNYRGSRKLVDGPEDEMGPKGFQSDGSRFYLSYRVVERFEPQAQAAYADGRLGVFDREFNLLQDLWLTDPDDSLYLRDHTSIALAQGRVYVAYAYGSAELSGNRDVLVNVYKWR